MTFTTLLPAATPFHAPSIAPARPTPTPHPKPMPGTGSGLVRETYTAKNVELPEGQLGTLARKEGQAPVGDAPIDAAHDNAKVVYDFYKTVLGRNSLDGAGMALKSTAHFGTNFNNAYWDGTHMTYGDGDGKLFTPLTGALDVVGHEMTHGVTERTAGLDYANQSGALNESWSDVMGELIQQWHADPKAFATPEYAAKQDWLIGEEVFTPGTKGDALRSLKAPGTAYSRDPQPADMAHYVKTADDNGGVHINSGIPNHAAYEAAVKIGGEKVAKIWYAALTDGLKAGSQFQDAANATVAAAKQLYKDGPESQAVADAWTAVGITPGAASVPDPGLAPAAPTSAQNPGIVPEWLRVPTATAG